MTYHIRFSSIKNMLMLAQKLIEGKVIGSEVEELLKHEDYAFELERYRGRVTESEFVVYLLQSASLRADMIENQDLKAHDQYYKDLFANPDFYLEKLKALEKLLTPELFDEQIRVALKGLPEDIEFPEFHFIFTVGIGQSFGYAYGNGIHFDFLQLIKNYNLDDFCSTMAHEIHHLGFQKVIEAIDFQMLSLESLFYLAFAGEGLAVKYCNNAEGLLSKCISSGPKNIGLDPYTWHYLNTDFEATWVQFKKTVDDIRRGSISSFQELDQHILDYWMNPYTPIQGKAEIPLLKQSRLYSFGNEIWGVIDDVYGKQVVYDALLHLETFSEVLSHALDYLGYKDIGLTFPH